MLQGFTGAILLASIFSLVLSAFFSGRPKKSDVVCVTAPVPSLRSIIPCR